MEAEFLSKIQELVERDEPIQMDDVFRDYEEWDSLAYLSVVAYIDEKHNIVIPFEKFRDFQTIREIYEYINNKK